MACFNSKEVIMLIVMMAALFALGWTWAIFTRLWHLEERLIRRACDKYGLNWDDVKSDANKS